ncbi:hypothetical protein PENANT_c020G05804 [Penicillium antarcticum]|uniref:AAA+ ATPase domain-containing protein n=1 Tax=Penicillium antarcticum TaxID=416450 RepID=A0A1V6Q018_9EURO|nr:uncharacterized protein N7508_004481 [Penicillium antarcticum]KAJ5309102.1 hypothetical protein N7508_004481 [Penicillium antarcticum]OQD82618.1 hypothetical protein PENANT_c020G05804 [Penicillium antarcticum]
MSRPSAKLCAECFPGALRTSRGVRPARLRGAARERSYATEHRTLATPNSSRASAVCTSSSRIPRPQLASRSRKARGLATITDGAVGGEKKVSVAPKDGPLAEYNLRVEECRLRDDEYQRGIIQGLQDLFEALKDYHPPKVVHPDPQSLDLQQKPSFFGSLFGGSKKAAKSTIPENLPKGLYMYGDVGCGKTMLMDLFFDTLPPNIKDKTRIHFHNFMQDVHKRMHVYKMKYGNDFDALPMVAADIAETASVLCFDEFQCTDVADAMILRRLLEILMSHGIVLVTTSNRQPDDLYKNGIQRESFIPCINLLKNDLSVINLNSPTDYRKIPRPPAAVYHHPLGEDAQRHAQKWFEFLGDPINDPPHADSQVVWGREIKVPQASGKAALFTFQHLIGTATGAADYLELVRHYDAFIVTEVPSMDHKSRDLARRFITFIDAVYESRAKLVLTSEAPLANLFISESEVKDAAKKSGDHSDLSDAMRSLMDDLGMSVDTLKKTSIFSGDEERFAFARALSRLSEMGSKEWVERGTGVGMSPEQSKEEREAWLKTRSHWSEDNM